MSVQSSDLNHPLPENNAERAETSEVVRLGEYARNGDFHKNISKDWNYYPIYVNKLEIVDEYINKYTPCDGKILDAGCGEGVLVDKYSQLGWDIVGMDKNYASKTVVQGSLTEIPFEPQTFDTVMCLDVLEHLTFQDQIKALSELRRVVKNDGTLIVSIPNLAHFTARLKFLKRGKLLHTASPDHHPGDRPMIEYEELLRITYFEVVEKQGIFPTVPPLYRFVMKNPSKSAELLRSLRKWPLPVDWNFQILFASRAVLKMSPAESLL